MTAAESQQAGGAISRVEEPLLEGVVCCTAHQQGLTREEVECCQGPIVSILHACNTHTDTDGASTACWVTIDMHATLQDH